MASIMSYGDTPSAMQSGTFSTPVTDYIMNLFGQNSAAQQNRYNAEQAALMRDFNSAEAEKQRKFEERMSNTAYQRAIADMNAAGLNTALAYSQGGASVPHAASASSSSASASSGGNALSGLLGGVIGSITSLAKTAIQANSASAVADQYADSRRDIAKVYADTRKDIAKSSSKSAMERLRFKEQRNDARFDAVGTTNFYDNQGNLHHYIISDKKRYPSSTNKYGY